jgi:tRNA-dihydrouridine synthase
MRTGWDERSIVAPELARIAVAEGAELLSVHGRTRAQQYTGRADRGIIRAVVEAVPGTPVLANGDVMTPQDVFEMLRETGAAGVMIGRGAMGIPGSSSRPSRWRAPAPCGDPPARTGWRPSSATPA